MLTNSSSVIWPLKCFGPHHSLSEIWCFQKAQVFRWFGTMHHIVFRQTWSRFLFIFLFALPFPTNMLVGCFVLLWYDKGNGYKFQRLFIPFGKMSLTNYIAQSIIGVSLFYGFGFNLYKTTGATACLIIAVLIFIALLIFSTLWLKNHKQGPLVWIWKKLTWINSPK